MGALGGELRPGAERPVVKPRLYPASSEPRFTHPCEWAPPTLQGTHPPVWPALTSLPSAPPGDGTPQDMGSCQPWPLMWVAGPEGGREGSATFAEAAPGVSLLQERRGLGSPCTSTPAVVCGQHAGAHPGVTASTRLSNRPIAPPGPPRGSPRPAGPALLGAALSRGSCCLPLISHRKGKKRQQGRGRRTPARQGSGSLCSHRAGRPPGP